MGSEYEARDDTDPAVSELIATGLQESRSPEEVIEDIHAAAQAEAGVSEELSYGQVGPRFDRRSPFYIGLTGAAGAAVMLLIGWVVVEIRQILLLILLAFVIAVGMDPVVRWLLRRGLPRGAAVTIVLLAAIAMFAGFLALAIPPLVSQVTTLAKDAPHYVQSLSNRHTFLGNLNARYHLERAVRNLIAKGGTTSAIAGGVLGFGKIVLDLVGSVVVVAILSIYLLADLPRVKHGVYRLAPSSRRARMVLLTDEIMARTGGYVLGKLLNSLIAGVATWLWALAWNIPYALLLGLLVALLDLIPVIGSTVGGVIVSLVALTNSLAIAIATALYYTLFRGFEDYVLTPKIMVRTVQVPGLVTVIATIIGAAVFGLIGALIAIPVAAGIQLLLEETTFRHLERR